MSIQFLYISFDLYSAGGVVVTALQGRIQCNNTLDARLDLAAEKVCGIFRDISSSSIMYGLFTYFVSIR